MDLICLPSPFRHPWRLETKPCFVVDFISLWVRKWTNHLEFLPIYSKIWHSTIFLFHDCPLIHFAFREVIEMNHEIECWIIDLLFLFLREKCHNYFQNVRVIKMRERFILMGNYYKIYARKWMKNETTPDTHDICGQKFSPTPKCLCWNLGSMGSMGILTSIRNNRWYH